MVKDGEPTSGLDCLRRLRDRFRHAVWLNPDGPPQWDGEWAESYNQIESMFPMYPLTVEGLEDGMKKLLAR